MVAVIMRHHLFRILPYAIMAASVGLSGITALAPVPNRPIAAVFPPWWTARQAFGAAALAGAPIVRSGGFSSIVVLAPGTPDLPQRLRNAGAWLLVDAQAVGACGANI